MRVIVTEESQVRFKKRLEMPGTILSVPNDMGEELLALGCVSVVSASDSGDDEAKAVAAEKRAAAKAAAAEKKAADKAVAAEKRAAAKAAATKKKAADKAAAKNQTRKTAKK